MKRRVKPSVEELPERKTPSGTAAGNAVVPTGTEVPLGGDRLPPPLHVSLGGSITFLPPGVVRFFGESNDAPPPVEVRRDGTAAFVPPGVARFIVGPND